MLYEIKLDTFVNHETELQLMIDRLVQLGRKYVVDINNINKIKGREISIDPGNLIIKIENADPAPH